MLAGNMKRVTLHGWFRSARALPVLALLLAAALVMGACGSPSAPDPGQSSGDGQGSSDEPTTFIRGTVGLALSAPFNPLLRMGNPRAALWSFNRLVAYNSRLEPVGELAESWDVSGDGLVYTFHLRKDVKWHDGAPFTADDVIFTAETALNEENNAATRKYWLIGGEPVKVEKIDDYTVQMTLPKPSALFLFNMSSWNMIVPKHLLEGVDLATADYNRHPIGTGPFKVVELVDNQYIRMEANPDYFLGAPKIDVWIDKQIPDQNAAIAALANGEVDMIGIGGKDALETVRQLPDVEVYGYDAGWILGVTFKRDRSFFDDVRVRRALAYALDREGMVQAIAGDVEVAWSLIGPPSSWAYNPDVPRYPQDIEKAKALLAEAGFTPGSDGTLTRDGRRFEFTLLVQSPATDSDPEAFAAVLQQAWKAIGVDMKIQRLDRATLESRLFVDRDFDAYIWWDGYNFEPDPSMFWHSATNINGFASAEIDALIEEANANADQAVRKAALDQLAVKVADEVLFIPLYYYRGFSAVKAYVKGVPAPSAADFNNSGILYEVHKLYIDKGK